MKNNMFQEGLHNAATTQSTALKDMHAEWEGEDAYVDEMTPQEWREFDEWISREEGLASIRTIRTRCIMDGVQTLDDAIGELEDYITYLKELQREGYALCAPIIDDYGYLYLEKRHS